MAPSEWDRILKINVDSIDTDNVDQYYDILSEVDSEGVDDTNKLRHAFDVVQTLMILKHEQIKGLEDETREKDGKLKDLKNQKRELETENANLQRLGAGVSDRELIQEKRGWEIEQERLENELRDMTDRLREVTLLKDKLESDKSELTVKVERLTEDKTRLSENCNFLKTQNEHLHGRTAGGDNVETTKQLSYFRSEHRAQKAQIDSLRDDNHKLIEDVERLQQNLREATFEVEKATDEYSKMKSMVTDKDHLFEELVTENKLLKEQVASLTDHLDNKDDQIMIDLNNKVEEWKGLFAEQDQKIVQLYQENRRLRQEIQAAGVDGDKASMQALFKAIKERETQVKLLEGKLAEATREIEENADVMNEMKKEMESTGRGPSDRQATKIRELALMVKEKEEMAKAMAERMKMAEQQAEEKDKEIGDLAERARRYEDGEYGLGDAVAEIKAAKAQVNIRDRQIEELCQAVNRVQMESQDFKIENEHLRTKMGIALDAPIDLEGYRRQKAVQIEEERALSLVLQKEIENLEDERLDLKKKLRILARQAGQKAGSCGIPVTSVLDVDALDEVDEDVAMRRSRNTFSAAPNRSMAMDSYRGHRDPHADTMKVRMSELDKEVGQNMKNLDEQMRHNLQLATQNEHLAEENEGLRQGLRELNTRMKEVSVSGVNATHRGIECPAVEKLLAVMDARKASSDFDSGLYLKARVDNLEGRNDELRKELRESRVENATCRLKLDKASERLNTVEEELKLLNDMGASAGPIRTNGLPDGMSPTSADTIASLNEHLVQTLHQLDEKEKQVTRMDQALESYRRKYALTRHQQGHLYKDFVEQRKTWETEQKKLGEKLSNVEGLRAEDNVRLQEFDRLLVTLNKPEPEIKRRLGELTRQITVLRVNEKALVRRYDAVVDMESGLRRENNRLKNEIIQMEATVTERLGYYQRYKEMAAFKVNALQKALDDSVPQDDMNRLLRQKEDLNEKYRGFLERQNALIGQSATYDQMETELQQTRLDVSTLKRELEREKERRHVLETAWEEMKIQNTSTGPNVSLNESRLVSISKKVTTLEMKELNERERADHATRMFDSLKISWSELDRRNKELEDKFAELAKMHLEQQKTERELRDELTGCVSKEINDADKKRISVLEKSEMLLKHEMEKLKEITEIATTQAKTLQEQQVSRDKEVTSLRQQLLDIQCQSEEKTVIGKLHRHLVQLQLSEATAIRKAEEAQRKAKRLEATLLRLERKMDERDAALYHTRMEARARAKHLKDTVTSLRSQFAGCVPLSKQEKFTKILMDLQEEKRRIQQELRSAEEKRLSSEEELDVIKVKHEGLQELTAAIKDNKGASKVAEWHTRMEQLRLDEMKEKRQVERLRHQLRHLEAVIKSQEVQLLQLEEDSARQAKIFEEAQLAWEQREGEMERAVDNLEAAHGEIVTVAGRLESARGRGTDRGESEGIPDPNMPLPHQLDHAVATIKKNLRTIFEQQAENQEMRRKLKIAEDKMSEMERTLLKRDRYINELRLRLPASTERDAQLAEASANAMRAVSDSEYNQGRANYAEEKTLEAAQTTIATLRGRLKVKEESVAKYQELLKQGREELEAVNHKHAEQLKILHQKLNARMGDSADRLQSTVKEISSRQMTLAVTNDQVKRLQELEDTVGEQNHAMIIQNDSLKEARRHAEEWKSKFEQLAKASAAEKAHLDRQYKETLAANQDDSHSFQNKLIQRERDIDALEKEVSRLKTECAKSPSNTVKHLVDRLKSQLAEKEKEQKALSKALLELRKDLVTHAEETLMVTTAEAGHERDVQKILERHTKDMADELDSLRGQNEKLKKDLKKARDERSALQAELDEMHTETSRKESLLNRIKADRSRVEQENEDLTRQIERLKSMRRQAPDDQHMRSEVEELKRKLRLVEEDNKRYRLAAERPYESEEPVNIRVSKTVASAPPGQGTDTIARWEEVKKAQRQAEKMREKLVAKDMDMEKISRQLELTRNALDRANRDKSELESRLIRQWGPGALPEISPPTGGQLHLVEELRERIHDLEDRLARAGGHAHVVTGDSGGINETVLLKEAQTRNRVLHDRIEELERQMVSNGNITVVNLERDRAHQKDLLRAKEDNIELRFEVENARKEIPRLRERVQDLQKYVEVLKAEKGHGDMKTDRSLESTTSSLGVRKIGESGKTTKQLEKVIARLKKAVERTEAENERLKGAPGIVSNEQLNLLRSENDTLKRQVAEIREQMGAKLAERYDAKDKGTVKIMTDYERMRKDLAKEVDTLEKTRMDLRRCQAELESSRREAMDLKSRLEIEGAKRGSLNGDPLSTGGAGLSETGGEWKSPVTARMYESRLKKMEEEANRRAQTLDEMKRACREWAQKEQDWTRERSELMRKIAVLERGIKIDGDADVADMMRQLQQLRLKTDRLEAENQLLNSQLAQTNGAKPGENLGEKLRNADALLAENIELRMQMKQMEMGKQTGDRDQRKIMNGDMDLLKSKYNEALTRNQSLETQLKVLSEQFGVSVRL